MTVCSILEYYTHYLLVVVIVDIVTQHFELVLPLIQRLLLFLLLNICLEEEEKSTQRHAKKWQP